MQVYRNYATNFLNIFGIVTLSWITGNNIAFTATFADIQKYQTICQRWNNCSSTYTPNFGNDCSFFDNILYLQHIS